MAKQAEKYDIFVSYAQVDNTKVFDREGWVSTLIINLRRLLNKEIGHADRVSIWWDKTNLNPYDPVTPEILQKVQNSSILLLILSSGYIESKWCQEEMTLFLQTLKTNPQKRIFVVHTKPFHEDQSMPPELKDLLGYHFWYREVESSRVRTMTIHDDEIHKNNFVKKVQDLAEDLSKKLKIIKAYPPLISAPPKASVYLAEVTEDLEPQRDEVKRYLENAQIRVLPDRLHLEGDTFQETLSDELPPCSLFIQLLGKVVSRTPTEILQSHARFEFEQTQLHDVPIFQWRDPNLVIDDVEPSTQYKLLTAETVYAEPLSTFKARVAEVAKTQGIFKSPSQATVFPESPPLVFINAEKLDQPLARMIHEQIDSRLQKALQEYNETPSNIRKNLEKNLVKCDALIVVYGNAPQDWITHQISQWQRIKIRRKQQIRICCLYDGPPEDKPDVSIDIPEMEILPFRNGLDQQRLNEFLAPLL